MKNDRKTAETAEARAGHGRAVNKAQLKRGQGTRKPVNRAHLNSGQGTRKAVNRAHLNSGQGIAEMFYIQCFSKRSGGFAA